MRPAVDQEHSIRGDPVAGQGGEARLDVFRQGGGADVEAQLDGRRHLIDVLPAGA